MRHLRTSAVFLPLLLALAAPAALAQQADGIEHRMSAAEFKAAGLDKLSPQELAALNAWMRQRIGSETATARQAADEARQARRLPRETIESRIVGEFTGFAKGRRYTLANGQVWEQTEPATLSGVRMTDPEVRIKPGLMGNVWYLQVKGYNTQPKVMLVD